MLGYVPAEIPKFLSPDQEGKRPSRARVRHIILSLRFKLGAATYEEAACIALQRGICLPTPEEVYATSLVGSKVVVLTCLLVAVLQALASGMSENVIILRCQLDREDLQRQTAQLANRLKVRKRRFCILLAAIQYGLLSYDAVFSAPRAEAG